MSIRDTAEALNISHYTLKNWLKRENQNLEEFRLAPEEQRLTKRANKKHSREQTLPLESLLYKENLPSLTVIMENLRKLNFDTHQTLFLFVLLLLNRKGYLRFSPHHFPERPPSQKECGDYPVLRKVLEDFYAGLLPFPSRPDLPKALLQKDLFPRRLLKEPDLPGLLYQSLRQEGNKILHGAYFTPPQVIREMLEPYRSEAKTTGFLDPCCGSGMFLCAYAEMTGAPENAAGMDKDPAAVFLARVNLFLRFPRISALDNIRVADALHPESWNLKKNSVIATNPPWGAHYSQQEKRKFLRQYDPIRSGESFALFIARSIKELPEGGRASFLLPESLLYVKTHKDIREMILKDAPPFRITHFGRLFHRVYTPVIQMELRKGSRIRKAGIRIKSSRKPFRLSEKQNLSRYKKNSNSIMNIHCSNQDAQILKKIYSIPSSHMGKDCKWILGTVTGDNKRFLTEEPASGTIPVLTGKEIHPFYTSPPRLFIRTDAGTWQQSRRQEEYEPAKIVYTFIGNRPAFAVDRSGVMTLNSANCLIPGQKDSLEELTAWFNSGLFRFLWRKQYHSLKLLKNHLETLPLPKWDISQKAQLFHLVKKAENRQDVMPEIDQMIYDLYEISLKDRKYVASEQWL